MSKRIVRNSCFESNSSSSHSIIVTKNDTYVTHDELVVNEERDNYNDETLWMYDDGKLRLRDIDDGYGRYPFQLLTTFKEKLKYAMCEYMGYYYGDEPEFLDKYNEFLEIVGDIIPEFEDFRIDTRDVDIYVDADGNELKHSQLKYDHWDEENKESVYVYADSNGNKQVAILSDKYLEVPAIGNIDHQSSGLLTNFLKDRGISLKEFLTNKKYVVVIDGDEYNDFARYMKSGLININYITEIYDTFGDYLEYLEWLKEQEENDNETDN